MNHKNINDVCERLGLKVQRTPDTGRRSYSATFPVHNGVRVYWSTSDLGGMLGLPRVAYQGKDTHARTIQEIEYLVKL